MIFTGCTCCTQINLSALCVLTCACLQQPSGRVARVIGEDTEAKRKLAQKTLLVNDSIRMGTRQHAFQACVLNPFISSSASIQLICEPKRMKLREFLLKILQLPQETTFSCSLCRSGCRSLCPNIIVGQWWLTAAPRCPRPQDYII